MQFINSLSIAPDARDWLANSRQPRVLHVFDRACNLINERREVLSIVTREVGNGPFNLVIDQPVVFSTHLDIESQVAINPGCLRAGEKTIDIENAELWSPRPDWEKSHAMRDDILSQIMSLRGRWFSARHLRRTACVAVQVSNPFVNFEIASSQRASTLLATTSSTTNYQSLISSLSFALAQAEISAALKITSQLAGLGAGLTPAGDDFIMGAVLAVWIIHPQEIATVIAEEVTNTAAPLTTSLSAAWLRSAGKGEAGVLWHEFFCALTSANTMQIEEAINGILAVGETSGADALAGFIGTLICWAQVGATRPS